MTGITIDILTTILMVILAFICGYSAGHRYGREEVRKSVSQISENLVHMIEGPKKQITDDAYNGKWSMGQKERDTKNE